jgi:hypothetical protein
VEVLRTDLYLFKVESKAMKPRMRLKDSFFDGGWIYHWWECWSPDGRIGHGFSPKSAYEAWSKA